MRDHVGEQLGNYRVLRLVGRGGSASVYLGEHVYLKSPAALKILHAPLTDQDTIQFVTEAQTLVRLTHPHIVRVLDFAVQDGIPFLVMEYSPHGSLRKLHPTGTRVPLETIVVYVQQVASALQHAHDQRLLHRDVKPENMLWSARFEVLLSDFGLALFTPHTLSMETQAMEQSMTGTTPYLAPEQLQGKPRPASDQYALGVVVYEWLCGRRPFSGSPIEIAMQHLSTPPAPLREHVPALPPAVEEVVLRALGKEPRDRFASVQDFANALQRAWQEGVSPHTLAASAPALPADHLGLSRAVPTERVEDPSSAESVSASSPAPSTGHGEEQHAAGNTAREPLWRVPTTLTSLVGRELDIADLCALLLRPEVRLVTIVGAGGVGKTRLSIGNATALRNSFADGVCFVELAPISDPDLVMPTIAHTLSIQQEGAQPIIEHMKTALQERQLLLILDNFEQVMLAAPQIVDLLVACPQLKVQVTSREVLHLQAEHLFPVSPLALPDLTHLPEREELAQYAAVSLFLQRAQAVLPGFQLTDANAEAIAELCVRLDGLPLALELAAARMRLLPPQALLARLGQQLQVLRGGPRDVPVRQQTMRNTIAWSYHLLEAQEQRLFRRLSVFVGGCTLEAIEAICAAFADGAGYVLEGVPSLLDKSLLRQTEHEGGEPRLGMLETVREYGLECLRESGEAEVSQRAHALHYLAFAEEAEPHLKGAQQVLWWRRLEREQENLRAALAWLIGQEEGELALRLSGAMCWFWNIRGYWSEGWHWLEAALQLPQAQGRTARRAKALSGAGLVTSLIGHPAARALLEESVAIYRELGDKRGLTEALGWLGLVLYHSTQSGTEVAAARALLEESLVLAREVGDLWILANALRNVGEFMLDHGDYKSACLLLGESVTLYRALKDQQALSRALRELTNAMLSEGQVTQAAVLAQENLALARGLDNGPDLTRALFWLAVIQAVQGKNEEAAILLEESLALAREQGDKSIMGNILLTMGGLAMYQGDLLRAENCAQESLMLFRELRSKDLTAMALSLLGGIRRRQGDLTQARAIYTEGTLLAWEGDGIQSKGWNLIGLATVAADEGQLEHAARLFGAAEPWLNPSTGMDPAERADYERAMEGVRMQLGVKVFAAAWVEGRAMTIEPSSAPPTKRLPTYPAGLTVREVEVLRLVAQGLTDAQVAAQLVVSPRTVNFHLTSIYGKIGVSSRSAATRYAIEQRLV